MRTFRGSLSWVRGLPGMGADRMPADLEQALNALLDRLLLVGLFAHPLVLATYAYRTAGGASS